MLVTEMFSITEASFSEDNAGSEGDCSSARRDSTSSEGQAAVGVEIEVGAAARPLFLEDPDIPRSFEATANESSDDAWNSRGCRGRWYFLG